MAFNLRKLEYLSPSGISKFDSDIEQFYMRYLSAHRPPDDPQSQPMAVGSAFDAYCKSYLHEKLFGKDNDPKYEFQTLFEAQVQPHVRDWALEAGRYAFEQYQKSGALSDLMIELQQAINVPKFEIEVKGAIHGYREGIIKSEMGVTFLGKPDVFYMNKHGAHVVVDWKVNGFCSKYPKSPMPGYVRLRMDRKKSGAHADAGLIMHKGTIINAACYLESLDADWAAQLSIYAWLLGCVSKNTWTVTSEGPRQVKDLINKSFVIVVNGHKYKTDGFFCTGHKEVFEIETIEGHKVQATAEHKFLVNYSGTRQWQHLDKLKIGDFLYLNEHKNLEWGGEGDFNEGYILGWLYGDGFFSGKGVEGGKNGLYFYPDDFCMLPFVQEKLKNQSAIQLFYFEKKQCYRLRSSEIEEMRKKYGLDKAKIINEYLEGASSEFLKGFISAFFDTDGHARKETFVISLKQSNLKRLEAVQRILLRFGINSSIRKTENSGETTIQGVKCKVKSKFELSIRKENTDIFNQRIGFQHPRKRQAAEESSENRNRTFKENFMCRVKSIKSIGMEDVYDITVPEVHAFDANGFMAHNCTVGDDYIVGIEQLCCAPAIGQPWPTIRIAEHRLRVSKDFQFKLFAHAQEIWNLAHSDHFFRNMTKEESQARCDLLDQQAAAWHKPMTDDDRKFMELTRMEVPFYNKKKIP